MKLSTLPLLAGRTIDAAFVVPTVAATVDLVVHCELRSDGRRRIAEIAAPTGRSSDGVVEATPLYATLRGELVPTGEQPVRAARFRREGADALAALASPVATAAVG